MCRFSHRRRLGPGFGDQKDHMTGEPNFSSQIFRLTFFRPTFRFPQPKFLMTFFSDISSLRRTLPENVCCQTLGGREWNRRSSVDIYDDGKYIRNPKYLRGRKQRPSHHLKFRGTSPAIPLSLCPWVHFSVCLFVYLCRSVHCIRLSVCLNI